MQRKLPDQLRGPDWGRTEKVIGAFFDTYNSLGYGFLESVYRRALAIELRSKGLEVKCETPISVLFKGEVVGAYRLDLLVDDRIAVEVKATSLLGPTDKRQLLNYLKTSSLDVGLLLHFGPEPNVYRIVSPRVVNAADVVKSGSFPEIR